MADTIIEPLERAGREVRDWAAEEREAYQGSARRPLGSYLTLIAVYLGLSTIGAVLLRRREKVPSRIPLADLGLMAVATYRLSRLVSKSAITSPIRAPFTRLEGRGAPAEVNERARGRGARKALGELLSCPFCIAQWISTSLVFAYGRAPRAVRVLATVMSVTAVSDWLQYAYARLGKPVSEEAPAAD